MTQARSIAVFIMLAVLTGCVGDSPPAQPGTGSKYVVKNQSYKRVWRAAMAAAGRNISVTTSSEASGIIRGKASGAEEVGVFLRRDRSDPMITEVEVAGGKPTGLTITSSFYNSPTARNWGNLIFKEMQYELDNMDINDALALAPKPTSLRLQDMSPEMRQAQQNDMRAQIRREIQSQMPQQPQQAQQAPAQMDMRAQIREEVRLQMEQEMRNRAQSQYPTQGYQQPSAGFAPAPPATPTRQAVVPTAPAPAVAAPLPRTTLSLRERLRELRKLYQDQLISPAEYEAQKSKILNDL